MQFASTEWFVLMLMAGVAVGVAVAMAMKAFRRDDD